MEKKSKRERDAENLEIRKEHEDKGDKYTDHDQCLNHLVSCLMETECCYCQTKNNNQDRFGGNDGLPLRVHQADDGEYQGRETDIPRDDCNYPLDQVKYEEGTVRGAHAEIFFMNTDIDIASSPFRLPL